MTTGSLVDRRSALERDILKKMILVEKIKFIETHEPQSSLVAYKPVVERQIEDMRIRLRRVESVIVKYGLGEPHAG